MLEDIDTLLEVIGQPEGFCPPRPEAWAEIEKCNVCYMSTTFPMIEEPERVLREILIPNFKYIYLGMTLMTDGVSKEKYAWGGMDSEDPSEPATPSVIWRFNREFFERICADYNVDLTIKGISGASANVTIIKK